MFGGLQLMLLIAVYASCSCVMPWRWREFRVEISCHKSKYYFVYDLLFRLSRSFLFFWFHFFITYGCMFCVLLSDFVNYVLLLLLCVGIIIIVMYVLFCMLRFHVTSGTLRLSW